MILQGDHGGQNSTSIKMVSLTVDHFTVYDTNYIENLKSSDSS